MIPREILKKIRRIEIRTNRIVTVVVGTARCAVQRRVQRRKHLPSVLSSNSFRPLIRGRGHRSAISLPNIQSL